MQRRIHDLYFVSNSQQFSKSKIIYYRFNIQVSGYKTIYAIGVIKISLHLVLIVSIDRISIKLMKVFNLLDVTVFFPVYYIKSTPLIMYKRHSFKEMYFNDVCFTTSSKLEKSFI